MLRFIMQPAVCMATVGTMATSEDKAEEIDESNVENADSVEPIDLDEEGDEEVRAGPDW